MPLVAFVVAVVGLAPSLKLFVAGNLGLVALGERAALAMVLAAVGVRLLAAAASLPGPSGPSAPKRRRTD